MSVGRRHAGVGIVVSGRYKQLDGPAAHLEVVHPEQSERLLGVRSLRHDRIDARLDHTLQVRELLRRILGDFQIEAPNGDRNDASQLTVENVEQRESKLDRVSAQEGSTAFGVEPKARQCGVGQQVPTSDSVYYKVAGERLADAAQHLVQHDAVATTRFHERRRDAGQSENQRQRKSEEEPAPLPPRSWVRGRFA